MPGKESMGVVDALDTTPLIDRSVREAVRLLETVRTEASQAAILPFIRHMAEATRNADEALAGAAACMDAKGDIDNEWFSKVFAAGSIHGAMRVFCQSFENDPSDHVRLACASGTIALGQVAVSADTVRVILAMQKRLENKS